MKRVSKLTLLNNYLNGKWGANCKVLDIGLGADGYPTVKENLGNDVYKTHRANRLALEKKLGRALLPKMLACHTCHNNKACVNPNHLYEGTYYNNLTDGNRTAPHKSPPAQRGSNANGAILTEELVKEIKEKVNTGCNQTLLAKELGVSKSTISAIKHGRIWNPEKYKL